ncbi:MAG: hypothetical protein GY854_18470 [Deltaproteobacteria bacterium]|nr:hypothetical protein [Deltaproteobacteria bacterium]
MSIVIGNSAPDSDWEIAWKDGAKVIDGETLALSSYGTDIKVLLLTYVSTS